MAGIPNGCVSDGKDLKPDKYFNSVILKKTSIKLKPDDSKYKKKNNSTVYKNKISLKESTGISEADITLGKLKCHDVNNSQSVYSQSKMYPG